MANVTINDLPTAVSIDASADILPIYTASALATQGINRNTLLGITGNPVGTSDSQTLTNKTITSPTISSPTLSGTISGTYTIGGTPTFPSSVVTLTGSQTLTNKTLTSPTINTPTLTNATISADAISGYTTSNSGTIYGISITTGAVSTSNVIPTAAIQNSAVTTAKIANNAITTSLLATGSNFEPATVATNPYKFLVYRTAALTITTTGVTVPFDTASFDTSSNVNLSSGTFTAPIAGFYLFGTTLEVAATASVTGLTITFTVNGTAITRFPRQGNINATQSGAGGSILYQLNATDAVTIVANTSGANAALDVGATRNSFYGFLVSAT